MSVNKGLLYLMEPVLLFVRACVQLVQQPVEQPASHVRLTQLLATVLVPAGLALLMMRHQLLVKQAVILSARHATIPLDAQLVYLEL